jgi:hypothetical protein
LVRFFINEFASADLYGNRMVSRTRFDAENAAHKMMCAYADVERWIVEEVPTEEAHEIDPANF